MLQTMFNSYEPVSDVRFSDEIIDFLSKKNKDTVISTLCIFGDDGVGKTFTLN
jgi:hypothetical protein